MWSEAGAVRDTEDEPVCAGVHNDVMRAFSLGGVCGNVLQQSSNTPSVCVCMSNILRLMTLYQFINAG